MERVGVGGRTGRGEGFVCKQSKQAKARSLHRKTGCLMHTQLRYLKKANVNL